MAKEKYFVANFSGGKDSTAMVLHLMETGAPLNEVINVDTGLEFPGMYEHIDKIKKIVQGYGIKYTTIKAAKGFDYWFSEHEFTTRQGEKKTGYSWPNRIARWCTSRLKTEPIKAHMSPLLAKYDVYHYIGLAADEKERLQRENNQNPSHIHPLVDWGWTESDALKYCIAKGYDWGGLYEIFNRVSCWCCPLQRISELKKLWEHFPDLWEQLKTWDSKTDRPFKDNLSVPMWEKRFELEETFKKQGLNSSMKTKAFRNALREEFKKMGVNTR